MRKDNRATMIYLFIIAFLIGAAALAWAAGELRHTDVGNEMTKTEWEAASTHYLDSGATGDVVYRNSDGALVRLAVGSAGDYLSVAGGLPAWATPLPGATPTPAYSLPASDGTPNPALSADALGRIGIGTTSPVGLLSVIYATANPTPMPQVLISNGDGSTAIDPYLKLYTGDGSVSGADIWYDVNVTDLMIGNRRDATVGDIIFRTRTLGTPMLMYYTGLGDLGIGVAPLYRLHAYTDEAGPIAYFQNDRNNTDATGITIQTGSDDPDTTTNTYLTALAGDEEPMGALRTIGGVFTLVQLSDERVKSGIVPSPIDATNILKAVPVKQFQFGDKEGAALHDDFIAQDVAEVFPQAVSSMSYTAVVDDVRTSKTLLGTAPTMLIPVLWKALQEAEARITALETKQATLDARIKILEAAIKP